MPMKRIGAAGAVAVAAVLCGGAMVGTVHEGLAGGVFFEPFKPPPPGIEPGKLSPENLVHPGTTLDDLPGGLPDSVTNSVIGTPEKDEATLSSSSRWNKFSPTSPPGIDVVPRYDLHVTATVNDLYAQAESGIIAKISDAHGALTENQIDAVVKDELSSALTEKTKEPGISFEVVSGKLKIEKSITIGGVVKISGGEANLYKTIKILGGLILACEYLKDPKFDNCIDTAVAKVRAIVIKEILENDAVASSNG